MASPVIGFAIAGLMLVFIAYFVFYPQYRSRISIQTKAPMVRPKALVFDNRFGGLSRVEGGEPLSDRKFKLELFNDTGTWYGNYYIGDLLPWNEYQALVGSGAPIYIYKKDYYDAKGKPVSGIAEVEALRKELEIAKAKSRIQINDPDEKVDKIMAWIAQIETSKKEKRPQI